jgi:hypothetical protein
VRRFAGRHALGARIAVGNAASLCAFPLWCGRSPGCWIASARGATCCAFTAIYQYGGHRYSITLSASDRIDGVHIEFRDGQRPRPPVHGYCTALPTGKSRPNAYTLQWTFVRALQAWSGPARRGGLQLWHLILRSSPRLRLF